MSIMSETSKQILYNIVDKTLMVGLSAAVLAAIIYVIHQAFIMHQVWALAVFVFAPPILAFFAWSLVYVGSSAEREELS